MYSTSHLFFLGDLNFRLDLPPTSPYAGRTNVNRVEAALDTQSGREELKEFDQLLRERRKRTIFHGLREGEFWAFKCSYKFKIGEVDKYRSVWSCKRAVKILTSCLDTADRERRLGQTGFYMQRIPTHPITQRARASLTSCSPQSHLILPLIMYVAILNFPLFGESMTLSLETYRGTLTSSVSDWCRPVG